MSTSPDPYSQYFCYSEWIHVLGTDIVALHHDERNPIFHKNYFQEINGAELCGLLRLARPDTYMCISENAQPIKVIIVDDYDNRFFTLSVEEMERFAYYCENPADYLKEDKVGWQEEGF